MKMKRTVFILTLLLTTALALLPVNAQEVRIPDANLAAVIREALGLGAGARITAAAMRELTELDADERGVADLTGLEHATQLRALDLDENDVRDISALANLTNLRELDLDENDVRDISALANLTNLRELDLSGTAVSDISALANLTSLWLLVLSNTAVSDISALANLTNLEILDLSDTDVSDISALANLTSHGPHRQRRALVFENCPLSPASEAHVRALRKRGLIVQFSKVAPPPPKPRPEWVLEDSWRGPRGDQLQHVEAIAFAGNNLVFWASGDRLYKWDFEANRAWWKDFDGRRVIDVAVPRWDLVTYALRGNNGEKDWVSLRRTADLSWVDSERQEGVMSLSADPGEEYLAVRGARNYYVYSVLDGRGLQSVSFRDTSSVTGAFAITSHLLSHRVGWLGFLSIWKDRSITIKHNSHRFRDLSDISVAGKAFTSGPLAVKSGGNGGLIAAASDASIYYFPLNTSTSEFTTVQSIANSNGEGHRRGPITGLAVMQGRDYDEGYYVTSTAHDDFVCFWSLSGGRLSRKLDVGFRSAEIAFSQYNSYMAVANGSISGGERRIKIYRWTGDSPIRLSAPAKATELVQPTALLSNYPNPFNPETWIPYQLSDPAEVTVSIYSGDGRLVRRLELGQMPAGVYSDKDRAAYWDGRNAQGEPVASGVYFYTLQAGDFKATRKMVIRK